MIVDKERKVIYLHNPKCGGTFLRELYIEKYGMSDATKWWKEYTRQYGTDLGHITYLDLPRFIPEWNEFKIVVMVRNPYNRFYSAFKETINRYRKIPVSTGLGFKIGLPSCLYLGEFQEWNIFRKICETLRICTGTYSQVLPKQEEPEKFCIRINSSKQSEQDKYIRNKRIPWLNPQSFYIGTDVEILRYESVDDWKKLLEVFELSEYEDRISIAKDYNIPDNICAIIKDLYPEDLKLFELYCGKTE